MSEQLAGHVNSESKAAFDGACDEVASSYEGIPEGNELVQKIVAKFKQFYDSPPVPIMEMLVRKNLSIEEAQIVLFKPRDEQLCYFPLFLSPVLDSVGDNKGALLKSMALTLLYIVHRKQWRFLKSFILCGGLDNLAHMITNENLYFRGQVIEILMSITDSETFDWFQKSNDTEVVDLHRHLLQLADHPVFVPALIGNRIASYPGGSFRCLQLLAFWMSWVRAMYTHDNRLHLGKTILEELYAWSNGVGESVMEDEITLAKTLYEDFGIKQYEIDEGGSSFDVSGLKEHQLGGINREAIGQQVVSSGGESSSKQTIIDIGNIKIASSPADAQPVVASSVSTPSISSSAGNKIAIEQPKERLLEEINRIKSDGNALFQAGNNEEAIRRYNDCLDLLATIPQDNNAPSTCAPESSSSVSALQLLEASLHYNKATIFWKQATQAVKASTANDATTLTSFDPDDDDILTGDANGTFELLQCEQSCRRAIGLHSLHIKATYRLANVLYKLQKVDEALEAMDAFLRAHDSYESKNSHKSAYSASKPNTTLAEGVNTIKAFQRKCYAAKLVRAKTDNMVSANKEALPFFDEGVTKALGNKTIKVLEALQKRNQREKSKCSHAWNGWTAPVEPGSNQDDTISTSASTEGEIIPLVHSVTSVECTTMPSTKTAKSATVKKAESKVKALTSVTTSKVQKKQAQDCCAQLKRLACDFERNPSATDRIANGVKWALTNAWNDGLSLPTIIFAALEMEIATLLVVCIFTLAHNPDDSSIASKALTELLQCQRFNTVLQISLIGNDDLRAKCQWIVSSPVFTADVISLFTKILK